MMTSAQSESSFDLVRWWFPLPNRIYQQMSGRQTKNSTNATYTSLNEADSNRMSILSKQVLEKSIVIHCSPSNAERKLKCDGLRPSCGNCDKRSNVCTYSPISGYVKWAVFFP